MAFKRNKEEERRLTEADEKRNGAFIHFSPEERSAVIGNELNRIEREYEERNYTGVRREAIQQDPRTGKDYIGQEGQGISYQTPSSGEGEYVGTADAKKAPSDGRSGASATGPYVQKPQQPLTEEQVEAKRNLREKSIKDITIRRAKWYASVGMIGHDELAKIMGPQKNGETPEDAAARFAQEGAVLSKQDETAKSQVVAKAAGKRAVSSARNAMSREQWQRAATDPNSTEARMLASMERVSSAQAGGNEEISADDLSRITQATDPENRGKYQTNVSNWQKRVFRDVEEGKAAIRSSLPKILAKVEGAEGTIMDAAADVLDTLSPVQKAAATRELEVADVALSKKRFESIEKQRAEIAITEARIAAQTKGEIEKRKALLPFETAAAIEKLEAEYPIRNKAAIALLTEKLPLERESSIAKFKETMAAETEALIERINATAPIETEQELLRLKETLPIQNEAALAQLEKVLELKQRSKENAAPADLKIEIEKLEKILGLQTEAALDQLEKRLPIEAKSRAAIAEEKAALRNKIEQERRDRTVQYNSADKETLRRNLFDLNLADDDAEVDAIIEGATVLGSSEAAKFDRAVNRAESQGVSVARSGKNGITWTESKTVTPKTTIVAGRVLQGRQLSKYLEFSPNSEALQDPDAEYITGSVKGTGVIVGTNGINIGNIADGLMTDDKNLSFTEALDRAIVYEAEATGEDPGNIKRAMGQEAFETLKKADDKRGEAYIEANSAAADKVLEDNIINADLKLENVTGSVQSLMADFTDFLSTSKLSETDQVSAFIDANANKIWTMAEQELSTLTDGDSELASEEVFRSARTKVRKIITGELSKGHAFNIEEGVLLQAEQEERQSRANENPDFDFRYGSDEPNAEAISFSKTDPIDQQFKDAYDGAGSAAGRSKIIEDLAEHKAVVRKSAVRRDELIKSLDDGFGWERATWAEGGTALEDRPLPGFQTTEPLENLDPFDTEFVLLGMQESVGQMWGLQTGLTYDDRRELQKRLTEMRAANKPKMEVELEKERTEVEKMYADTEAKRKGVETPQAAAERYRNDEAATKDMNDWVKRNQSNLTDKNLGPVVARMLEHGLLDDKNTIWLSGIITKAEKTHPVYRAVTGNKAGPNPFEEVKSQSDVTLGEE